MTEQTPAANGAPAEPPVLDPSVTIEVPHSALKDPADLTGTAMLPAVTLTVNATSIPADTRLDLLKQAIKSNVINRVNVAFSRYSKAMAPFTAYAEAMAKDPLQTAVAKPDGNPPATPVAVTIANAAIADLIAGTLRQRTGESKSRAPADPLVSTVTGSVVRAVFDANKAVNSSYKWTDATKAVGGNGIAYLNAQIEEKVAAAAEGERDALRKQLETSRDARYINPAKIMLGQTALTGKQASLPSLL